MIEQPYFKHQNDNGTFITPEDWPKVDETVDWLIEKNRSGGTLAPGNFED
jgi:hypothetical protein